MKNLMKAPLQMRHWGIEEQKLKSVAWESLCTE
jgi:hypothetical protein